MDEHDDLSAGGSFSRRSMIKKIGAGTAVAWSLPVVTSFSAQAFAASPNDACPAPCTTCFSTSCTPASASCGDNCLCSVTTEGDCFCARDAFGSGPCATTNDCLAGERCMNICASGCAGNFCLPGCTSPQGTSSRQGRPSQAA